MRVEIDKLQSNGNKVRVIGDDGVIIESVYIKDLPKSDGIVIYNSKENTQNKGRELEI